MGQQYCRGLVMDDECAPGPALGLPGSFLEMGQLCGFPTIHEEKEVLS